MSAWKTWVEASYFKEPLRIRDIRSSEKAFYRQVLDLFATSSDYNANSNWGKKFCDGSKQDAHYAAIHQYAANSYTIVLIVKRIYGLDNFKGDLPTLSEAKLLELSDRVTRA